MLKFDEQSELSAGAVPQKGSPCFRQNFCFNVSIKSGKFSENHHETSPHSSDIPRSFTSFSEVLKVVQVRCVYAACVVLRFASKH